MKNWVGLILMCLILNSPAACFQIHVNKAGGGGLVVFGEKSPKNGSEIWDMGDRAGSGTFLTGLWKAYL